MQLCGVGLEWGVAESQSDMVPATGFEPVRFYSLEPESSASANSATRAICNTTHWNLIAVWVYTCDSGCDRGGVLKSSQPPGHRAVTNSSSLRYTYTKLRDIRKHAIPGVVLWFYSSATKHFR